LTFSAPYDRIVYFMVLTDRPQDAGRYRLLITEYTSIIDGGVMDHPYLYSDNLEEILTYLRDNLDKFQIAAIEILDYSK
jgi:hypothetical protein